jgi:hypothetical protein
MKSLQLLRKLFHYADWDRPCVQVFFPAMSIVGKNRACTAVNMGGDPRAVIIAQVVLSQLRAIKALYKCSLYISENVFSLSCQNLLKNPDN